LTYTPFQRAQAFVEAGDLAEALKALNEAIEAAPDDESYRLRAAVLRRMRDEEHLRAAALDLEKLGNPTSTDYVEQSIIFEQLGDFSAAIRAMMVATDLAGGPSERNRLVEQHVRLLLTRGDTEKALELAQKQPKTWRWMQWMGDIAAQSDDNAGAARYYSAAISLLTSTTDRDDKFADAFRARLLLARADAHRKSGQYEFADADYVTAEQLTPGDPMIPFYRGLIAWQRGEQNEAVSLVRGAMDKANDMVQDTMRRVLVDDVTFSGLLQTVDP
jgi:tetratricopeptide (TPR) repeat protein